MVSASDTRTEATDESGRLVREHLAGAGHEVACYEVVTDDPGQIRRAVAQAVAQFDGVVITGGSGIAPRDSTIEAIRPLLDRELEGFGELFRMLSYQEIGSKAWLSRALAGVSNGRLVVALPGSPAACRLAMEKLVVPELGHIAYLLGL